MAGRALTGMATLGLSEIAWSYAKTQPHWLYFFDGMLVHFSRGFDCNKEKTCTYTGQAKPSKNQ